MFAMFIISLNFVCVSKFLCFDFSVGLCFFLSTWLNVIVSC